MRRQFYGVLTLALAVLSVGVVSAANGPQGIDGRPATEPVVAPPAVGACVSNRPISGWDVDGELMPAGNRYVPCNVEHLGEVYYVYDPAPSVSNPAENPNICADSRASLAAYLGIDAAAQGGWQPSVSLAFAVVGPSGRQSEAGQQWVACVIVDSSVGAPFRSESLHGAYPGGTVANALEWCLNEDEPGVGNLLPVPCGIPHSAEVFGAQRGTAVGEQGSEISCQVLAVRDTGRASLLGEPELRVQVVTNSDQPAIVATASDHQPDTAKCMIQAVGGRLLAASLRNIGDAQIPWAS